MKEEILAQLRSAEEDTQRRVDQAKQRAADLVTQAKKEAEEIVRSAEESSRKDEKAQVASERERLEKERARILQEGAAKEEALRKSYSKNVDAYVQKALEAFKESLNA